MAEPQHAKQIAYLMGAVSAIHKAAKVMESEGSPEMDMICCQLEDVFETFQSIFLEAASPDADSDPPQGR